MEKEFPNLKPVRVECHSGYKVNERSEAFFCQGERREICEILDCWYKGGIEPDRPIVDY